MENHQNRESTTNTSPSNNGELGTGTPPPSPDTTLSNHQIIDNQKYDALLQIIEAREKQRAKLLKRVLGFTITIISILYIVAVAVFGLIFCKMPEEEVVKLADFWHILLIFLLPPTSLLMMLIRGVSFSANSSEFKSSDSDNTGNILDNIPTSATTIAKEGIEIVTKILPINKEK